MVDEFPVDFSEPIGRVRKYIPDLIQLGDPANPNGPKSFIFSDDEIQSFIDDETINGALDVTSFRIRRAAAWAMIAIANSENLILKKLITQDQQTDGPAVAKAMIASAAMLFDQAKAEEDALSATTAVEGFMAVYPEQTHEFEYPAYHGGFVVRGLL
jgi:hypothetical protein